MFGLVDCRRDAALRDVDANPGVDVRRGVPGQHRHACALARRVGHHFVSLKDEAKLCDAQHHEQQHRKHECELDELRGVFRAEPPEQPFHLRHNVTTVPIAIGNAYASLGPLALFQRDRRQRRHAHDAPVGQQQIDVGQCLAQVAIRQRDDDGHDAADETRGQRDDGHLAWAEPRADCRQQLHVAGAHAAQGKHREKEQRADEEPDDAPAGRLPSASCEMEQHGAGRRRQRQHIRNSSRAQVCDACQREECADKEIEGRHGYEQPPPAEMGSGVQPDLIWMLVSALV